MFLTEPENAENHIQSELPWQKLFPFLTACLYTPQGLQMFLNCLEYLLMFLSESNKVDPSQSQKQSLLERESSLDSHLDRPSN